MQKLLIAILALVAPLATATTFTPDAGRTISVTSTIDKDILPLADQVVQLSVESDKPITLIINSPGGAVMPGLQFVSAMRVAQARGVEFRCFVPMMAASMAMVIFNECNQRFSLDQALFLWHPIRISFMGSLTPESAAAARQQMLILQQDFNDRMIKNMNMAPKTFYYYYLNEFFSVATHLHTLAPKYLTIVNDFTGVEAPFEL